MRQSLFHWWFRLSRPMTLGVRAIVENERGEVVLVRHTYVDGFYLPGGGVEKNETSLQALERELEEEAGLQLTSGAELIGVFSNHANMRNDHVLVYFAKNWTSVTLIDRGEIAEVVWVDPRHPPDDATAGTKRRLAEHYGNADQSLYW